jgi:hypothetical protein
MAGSVEQELYKDTKVEQLTKRKLSRLAERLYIRTHLGDVAQLARALDWQSRGRRFEPDLLHVERSPVWGFLHDYNIGREVYAERS